MTASPQSIRRAALEEGIDAILKLIEVHKRVAFKEGVWESVALLRALLDQSPAAGETASAQPSTVPPREPTEAMWQAAHKLGVTYDENLIPIWQAMYDAYLSANSQPKGTNDSTRD